MKKLCALAVLVALSAAALIFVPGCKKKASPVKIGSSGLSSAETTSFKEVTSKLDTGGSFYLYLSTEQWLKDLSTKVGNLRETVASLPNVQDKKEQINDAFTVGTGLIKDSGLEDISGLGMSSIARAPGLYYNKLIIHHYSGQGNGFIWTIFGKDPHELTGLNLLPANTAMAAFYDLDSAQVWAVIQKECEQSGFPQAKDFLKNFPQEFEKNTGMKWNDIVDSFDGEFGIVLTLNDAKMVNIPMPSGEPLEMGEPGFMLVAKIKNDLLFNHFDDALKKSRQRGLIKVDKDGLKMRTMPINLPLPITLRPSIATSGGYFFFATTDALIQEALAVKGGKAGLKSTDEFKRLSADVPQQGNQFCFLSQRFGQTIMKIQQRTLAMNNDTPPQVKQLMQSFLQPDKAAFMYAVGANTDEGWMTVANGNQGSANVLAASAVVPAVAAAIALPALAKAKETSQRNACINNLRMIDGAKQQWALENSKTASDVPSWNDIQPYLGGGKAILVCPKGGGYSLGAVGERPTCSFPGHGLPQ